MPFRPRLTLFIAAGTLLLAAPSAQAAFTTANCLAQKRNAQGNLQKCRASEESKALEGRPVDLAKCAARFQNRIAILSDRATRAAIPCRYADNGDGTVSDYDTGLQWEKKVFEPGGLNFDSVHHVHNRYFWADPTTCTFVGCQNGTMLTDFLSRLNTCTTNDGVSTTNAGFAGHCDWRVPTLRELTGILDPGAVGCGSGGACIDPIFGPADGVYWSSVTDGLPDHPWWVNVLDLSVGTGGGARRVRAVRGGL